MKWSGSSGEFQQPPTGTHLARCIGIIDLGTQKHDYQGTTRFTRDVVLRWELPTELMDDGRPFICSKFYNASLNEKSNLYGDLVNWRGKEFSEEELNGFDAKNVLDKTCMVALTEDKKGKVRVTGLMKGPRNLDVPPRANDLVFFSLEPDEFKREDFDALPEGFRKMIQRSPEYAELANGKSGQHDPLEHVDPLDSDDIPF